MIKSMPHPNQMKVRQVIS